MACITALHSTAERLHPHACRAALIIHTVLPLAALKDHKTGPCISSVAIYAPQYLAFTAHPHHALPAHADAVGVLVGAARSVVHQQLHIGNVPRLPRLAVQVAPLVCCEGREEGRSLNVRGTHLTKHESQLHLSFSISWN